MRITKTDAQSIAIKLTEKKQNEVIKTQEDLAKLGYEIAKKRVPKDVMDLFAKRKEYIESTSIVTLVGVGLSYERIDLKTSIPTSNGWSNVIQVTEEEARKVTKMTNALDKMEKEAESLRAEVESALLSLKTHAKITEQFSEAVPFLPFKQKSEIVVCIKDIRKKLN
jgi:vacuolar-type H+-ATPase subunit I/STV1